MVGRGLDMQLRPHAWYTVFKKPSELPDKQSDLPRPLVAPVHDADLAFFGPRASVAHGALAVPLFGQETRR